VKFIEDKEFRNKYKGEEIFVAGTGPSLDDFPEDWFDDKIVLSTNFAFIGIPNCVFTSCIHSNVAIRIRKEFPEWKKKLICCCPIDRVKMNSGEPYIKIGEYGDEVIYAHSSVGPHRPDVFIETAKNIMEKKPAILRQVGTSSHPPVQIAAILGASRITMVGCEEHTSKTKFHAIRGGLNVYEKEPLDFVPYLKGLIEYPKDWQEGTIKGPPKHRMGQVWLAEAFALHGIKVMKYFYKTGYQAMSYSGK